MGLRQWAEWLQATPITYMGNEDLDHYQPGAD